VPEFHVEAPQATVSEGLSQGLYVAARAGVEPLGRKASTLPMRHQAPQCNIITLHYCLLDLSK